MVRLRAAALCCLLLLPVALGACAGAFLPRAEPIDLGPDRARRVAISVEGPSDMPEWGELLWSELAQALSAPGVAQVVEPGPGVLQLTASVESWDYEERAEESFEALQSERRMRSTRPPAREGTALMGVTVEITDPATGKLLAQRRYLGVERDRQQLPLERFSAPRTLMRRAAGKVATQLAEDLEAGRAAAGAPPDGAR